ncbi:MAG: DUF952 domain-containing protein [Anaerolineae bacterium]
MTITYHLVSQVYFDSLDAKTDYLPAPFVQDGFIHCTDDPQEMARIANLFYRSEQPPHLYLYIDKDRVRAPIRYDDAEQRYPHIYGPLNRDAIVAIREAARDGEGRFLAPPR